MVILFAMLLSLAACAETVKPPEPTAAPTENAAEAPTAEPTAEPTAAPTEAPTPEPAATPAPKLLDFDDCAELVCTLPWGEGDLEVYFEHPNEDEGLSPQNFFVADNRVWIYDRFLYSGMGFIVYDMETGEVSRVSYKEEDIEINYEIWTRFAVMDGKLIGQRGMFDLETGEQYLLQPLVQNGSTEPEYLRHFQVRDGKLYGYVGYVDYYWEADLHDLTEYVLDLENRMWVPVRKILSSGGEKELVIVDTGAHIERGIYLGFDNEGCHYVQGEDFEGKGDDAVYHDAILKYAPDGRLISMVRIDKYNGFGEGLLDAYCPDRFSLVTEDGTVWIMLHLESGLRIYKLDMD